MSTLRYVVGASRDDGVSLRALEENECTIFKGDDRFPWHLRFSYRSKLDGMLYNGSVPIFPKAETPKSKPGWSLNRAPGGWQVSPSILISTRRPDPADPDKWIDIELWHETPLIVDVPEGERWVIDDGPFICGPAPNPEPHLEHKPRCVHGATAGACAFVGCAFYRPDGPRDERWAFRPGTTEEDIAAALAENAADLARPPHCCSPIHLVVERYRKTRVGE